MTILNPGSEVEKNQPVLTQELIDELEKNPDKIHQLSEAQLRALVEDDGEVVAERPKQAAPANAGASTQQSPSVAGANPDEKKAAPVAPNEDGEKYRQTKDELNTKSQQLDTVKRQLAEANALLDANKKAREGLTEAGKSKLDMNDENLMERLVDTVTRLQSEVTGLRTENETVLKSRAGTLEEDRAKTETDRTFLQIQQFQFRSKDLGIDLKTERPIRDIDKDMGRLDKLIGETNVKRLKTDKAYRDEMAKTGIELPKEWEKHDVIMQLHAFKNGEDKYPSYTSAFADFSEKSDVLKRKVQEAVLDGANATTDQIIKNSNEASVLPAASGAGAGSHRVEVTTWTKETASKWMTANPEPKTAADRKTQWDIMKWLESQPDD